VQRGACIDEQQPLLHRQQRERHWLQGVSRAAAAKAQANLDIKTLNPQQQNPKPLTIVTCVAVISSSQGSRDCREGGGRCSSLDMADTSNALAVDCSQCL